MKKTKSTTKRKQSRTVKKTKLHKVKHALKTKTFLGLKIHHLGLVLFVVGIGVAIGLNETMSKISTAGVPQRFPGDPNSLVSGKAFFGTSGNNVGAHEAAAGKSVAIYRKFNQWDTASSAVSTINSNYAANRLVWISFKTPDWSDVANGIYDTTLDSMLRTLDSAGKPVWVTFWHEPENDENTAGAGTATEWVNMQRHIRARMKSLGTKNIAFAPIYQSSKIVSMGAAHDAWYGAGIWDFIGFDVYQPVDTKSILDSKWTTTINWVLSKGLPYGVGEWGVRSTAPSSELTNFWNWAFQNHTDLVGVSYFDSDLNSDGSWTLVGANNTTFDSILKNDQRIMRVADLSAPTGGTAPPPTPPPAPTDTTPPSITITSPTNGAQVSGTILVAGTASDNIGVTSVSLLVDGALVSSDTSVPYQIDLDTKKYTDAAHTVLLRASDAAGNKKDSSTISISVKNSSASSPSPESPPSTAPVTVIKPSDLSNQPLPVAVSGVLDIQPSKPGNDISIKLDGKDTNSSKIDTGGLTNGNHVVTITENGVTKEIPISVKNPLHIAVVNEIKAHPVEYTVGGSGALTGAWFMRRQLLDLVIHGGRRLIFRI